MSDEDEVKRLARELLTVIKRETDNRDLALGGLLHLTRIVMRAAIATEGETERPRMLGMLLAVAQDLAPKGSRAREVQRQLEHVISEMMAGPPGARVAH